jgi:hypothetical protein
MYVCMYACNVDMYVWMDVYMYGYRHVCVHMHACILYVCVYADIHMYMHASICNTHIHACVV